MDHEDAYKHIDEVLDIENYFNGPNVSHSSMLFRMLLVAFKGVEKDWLKSLAAGAIWTWANHR